MVPVVGNFYMDGEATRQYAALTKGDSVHLLFNPTNRFDAYAVEVWTVKKSSDSKGIQPEKVHIGYLDKLTSKKIATKVEDFIVDYKILVSDRASLRLIGKVVSNVGRCMLSIVGVEEKR